MKFSLAPDHPYSIRSYGPGEVLVGNERYASSLVLTPDQPPRAWSPQHCDQLQATHFEELLALDAEIVVYGSGEKLRFPAADLTRCLVDRQIGFEVMDTASACRTYNVLLSEDRRVAAVLMMI